MLTPRQQAIAEKFVKEHGDEIRDEYIKNGKNMKQAIEQVAVRSLEGAIALKKKCDEDPSIGNHIFDCIVNKKVPFTV